MTALRFGDLAAKAAAHEDGKREQKIKAAMKEFRSAIVHLSRPGKTAEQILGATCGHCGHYPWQEHDWHCPLQIWHVRPKGIKADLMAEAARRVLAERNAA